MKSYYTGIIFSITGIVMILLALFGKSISKSDNMDDKLRAVIDNDNMNTGFIVFGIGLILITVSHEE